MMICWGDIHPDIGLFDQVEVAWPIHPFFLRCEAVNPARAGPGPQLLHYEETGG